MKGPQARLQRIDEQIVEVPISDCSEDIVKEFKMEPHGAILGKNL